MCVYLYYDWLFLNHTEVITFLNIKFIGFSVKFFEFCLCSMCRDIFPRITQIPICVFFRHYHGFHYFKFWSIWKYSWPLNNRGMNCMGPLICRFFSINTTVLYDQRLVESADMNLGYRRLTLKLIMWGFSYAWVVRWISVPSPQIVQGSTVVCCNIWDRYLALFSFKC